MVQTPVSIQARGQIRALLSQLEAESHRVVAATDRVPVSLIADALRKGEKGAERSCGRIAEIVGTRPLFRHKRQLAWRLLTPMPAVPAPTGQDPDEADRQRVVVVELLRFGAAGRPRWSREPFGCGYTAHALARLLDRTNFGADPWMVMLAGHDALLRLSRERGQEVFARDQVLLPAGPGAFATHPRRIGDTESPLAVARTWVHREQLYDDQTAELAAWRE